MVQNAARAGGFGEVSESHIYARGFARENVDGEFVPGGRGRPRCAHQRPQNEVTHWVVTCFISYAVFCLEKKNIIFLLLIDKQSESESTLSHFDANHVLALRRAEGGSLILESLPLH